MAINTDAVQRLYVAYFNRPADPVGLAYWESQLPSTAATQAQLATIAAGFSGSSEYTSLYSGQTNAQIVNNLYLNLFGRSAETAGLTSWAAQLAAGTQTFASIALQLTYSAQGTDATAIANKLSAATSFTTALDTTAEITGYSGTTAAASARTWLATVTDTAASLTAATATATLATAVSTAVAAGSAASGTTFTLTTGGDNLTGTANNDTFNATIDQATPANSTISAADIIAGGSGTDTLSITGTGTTLDVLNSALVTGIETVNIRATTANSLNASAITGLTTVNANLGAGTVLVTNLAAGAAIGIIGNGTVVQGELAFAPATAASAITLNIDGGVNQTEANDGVTAAATIAAGDATGTATTATINSTGAANITGVVDLANATLTSVTINAATNLKGNFLSQATNQVAATGSVTISGAATTVELTAALDNDIATINASGLTAGGIIASLGTLATQTVTGGVGADRIKTGGVLTTGSVNAGSGTDTLEVASAADLATAALGAKYTNFETLRLNDSQDASLISGITAIELNAMTSKAVTNMTATQAAAVKVLGDQTTGVTLALAAATGSSDVLTITAGTGLTTGAAFDLAALTVTGFETLNVFANAGPTATVGANRTVTIASLTGATLNTVNLTGTAFSITNGATTVATTFNASALTGDGTVAGSQGLTIAGSLVAGSTVTGSALIDTVTIGAEGTTYNMGAGADTFSATVALLVADGTTDGVINGGDGTDVITLTDTTTTLTDNHFTKLSNMETLTLSNTAGDASVTTGSAFNTAFANGATITTGILAATKDITFNGGLSSVAVNLTVDATSLVGTAAETHSITTGSAADTVTFTGDDTYVGVAGATGTIAISTGAGADTISVTYGSLLANTTNQTLTVTGGTGADLITKVGTNGTGATAGAKFVVASGDSGTTAATFDQITGFDIADGTNISDHIDFAGVGVLGTLATSTDFGTILSHSISNGFASFDDAAAYAAAVVVSSTNLADVVGYLAANTATQDVVAFLYDRDGNGSTDSTLVYSNLASDALVLLVGVTTATTLTTTLTTTTNLNIAVA